MSFRKSPCFAMFLTAVLMLGAAGSALAKIERFNSAYLKAEKLYKAKNYEKAEKLYKKSLVQCTSGDMDCRIKTLLGLRMLYTETKQYEQAIQIQNQFFEDYQQGKVSLYNMARLLIDRADLYHKQGSLEQSVQDYKMAIQLDEKEFGLASFRRMESLKKLAELYIQHGKTEVAAGIKAQAEVAGVNQRACHKDADFTDFIAKLQKRIRWNWFPPYEGGEYQIVAVFSLFRDGTISNVRMTKPMDSLAANQSAFAAIERSAPFRDVPTFCSDYVDIEFIFERERLPN